MSAPIDPLEVSLLRRQLAAAADTIAQLERDARRRTELLDLLAAELERAIEERAAVTFTQQPPSTP